MYVKTGCTVDIYTPKGFIKILMTDVERARGAGRSKILGIGGGCEGDGGGGGGGIWTAREAGEVMNTYIHRHTRYPHPPFTLQ